MTFLSKHNILQAGGVKYHELDVPEWGGTVRLKGWTVAEADDIAIAIRESIRSGQPMEDWAARICAVSIVDENGELMFADEEGFEQLCSLAPAGIGRVAKEIESINLPQKHAKTADEAVIDEAVAVMSGGSGEGESGSKTFKTLAEHEAEDHPKKAD